MQTQSDPVVENGLEELSSPEAEAAPVPEPIPAGPPPGEILRNAREARGESVNDIARILKLSAQQLEAIENGRFDVLPGPTFVRGFLRNYARYLEIPSEPLLEGISARTPTAADLASMIKLDGNVQPKASPRPRGRIFPVLLAALVLLAVAVLVGTGAYKGWFDFKFDMPAATLIRGKGAAPEPPKPARNEPQRPVEAEPQKPVEQPELQEPVEAGLQEPVEPEQPVEPAPQELQSTIQYKIQTIKLEQPVPVNIAPESAKDPLQAESEQAIAAALGQAPVPEEAALRLSFNASTLAQVRDNSGRLIFTRTGVKGSSSNVKGKPPFSVMVKQADNVKLEFKGQVVDLKEHTDRDGVARLTLE